jgi:hypothetical protein
MVSNRCIATVVFAGIACAGVARAQLDEPKRDVVFQTVDHFDAAVPPPPAGAGVATFKYIGAEAMIPGKVVKGAPYSATAVTETVQTLADGNRITSKISSFLARDSEGRTRREQSLPAIGPWATESAAPKLVTINDPVAGASYMLDGHTKTARKLENMQAQKLEYEQMMTLKGPAPAPADGPVVMIRSLAVAGAKPDSAAQPKQEKLGQSTIEGIMAEGTRTTTVIAAGTVGNELPMTVTDERWYSSELQMTVLSKHSDPRMGETTFRLTNVSRSEPAASLFQVPADYQTLEVGKDADGTYINRPVEIKIDKH